MVNLNNLFNLIAEKGLTAKKLSEETGISTGNISDWKSGRSFPTAAKLVTLADCLGCSVDYLLGRIDDPKFRKIDAPTIENKKADLPNIFDQDNMVTRYVCHLWETMNEIYSVNLLLNDSIGVNAYHRKTDWVIVFKYCIITLCEAAKIITLNENQLKSYFSGARDVIVQKFGAVKELNTVKSVWGKYSKFYKKARNSFVHFDHEQNDSYEDTIKNLDNKYEICRCYEIYNDFNNPISLELLINIYRKSSDNVSQLNNEEIIKEIINSAKEILQVMIAFLEKTVKCFWEQCITDEDGVLVPKESELESIALHSSEVTDIPERRTEDNPIYASYNSLNAEGQKKAFEYISDLLENPKYANNEKKSKNAIPTTEEILELLNETSDSTKVAAMGKGVHSVNAPNISAEELRKMLDEQ